MHLNIFPLMRQKARVFFASKHFKPSLIFQYQASIVFKYVTGQEALDNIKRSSLFGRRYNYKEKYFIKCALVLRHNPD
jgi:hypothetical protein